MEKMKITLLEELMKAVWMLIKELDDPSITVDFVYDVMEYGLIRELYGKVLAICTVMEQMGASASEIEYARNTAAELEGSSWNEITDVVKNYENYC